jgi:predicted  nucleic acid-binding Zn-ribbon protein
MSQTDSLYRLQQIDDEIKQKRQRLGEVLRLQTESQELLAARQRTKNTTSDLQKYRVQQQDLNLELKSLEDKAKRSENRLYSGLVKNPKELSDLQHEVEALSRRRKIMEDELIDAKILLEEAQEQNDEAASNLQRIESHWLTSQGTLKEEQNELARRVNELTGLRKEMVASIPPPLLAAYNNAYKRGAGTAVVVLHNNRCRGCQVTVPANVAKAANEGKLAYCDNCSRILYIA